VFGLQSRNTARCYSRSVPIEVGALGLTVLVLQSRSIHFRNEISHRWLRTLENIRTNQFHPSNSSFYQFVVSVSTLRFSAANLLSSISALPPSTAGFLLLPCLSRAKLATHAHLLCLPAGASMARAQTPTRRVLTALRADPRPPSVIQTRVRARASAGAWRAPRQGTHSRLATCPALARFHCPGRPMPAAGLAGVGCVTDSRHVLLGSKTKGSRVTRVSASRTESQYD
jgi:hypothetical protein